MIYYRRRKTGQTYTVKIIPEVQEILDRYRDRCFPWALPVMLDFDGEGRLRPRIRGRDGGGPQALEARGCICAINTTCRIICALPGYEQKLELPVKLSFNVARHSWASLARKHGVSVSVISAGLGHTSEKTTQIYLDELDSTVDAANAMVAGLLKAPAPDRGKGRRKVESAKNSIFAIGPQLCVSRGCGKIRSFGKDCGASFSAALS